MLPPLPLRGKPASSIPPFVPPPSVRAGARPAPKKKKRPLLLGGIAGVVLLAAGGAFFLLQQDSVEPVTAPLPPQANAIPPADPAAAERKPPSFAPLPPPPQPFASATPKPQPTVPLKPVVTPAFRAWTEDARVTGVVSGETPRAIINGRLVRPGDVVDAATGIIFEGLDTERKLVVFRSREGAFTNKPY